MKKRGTIFLSVVMCVCVREREREKAFIAQHVKKCSKLKMTVGMKNSSSGLVPAPRAGIKNQV